MTGRDLTLIGVGLLIAMGLGGLNDFISKVNTYSKVEEEITKIGNTYNTIKEQVEINKGNTSQALYMARSSLDKTDSLTRQQDSLQKQISELQILYQELKHKYQSQGQATSSTTSYPNY